MFFSKGCVAMTPARFIQKAMRAAAVWQRRAFAPQTPPKGTAVPAVKTTSGAGAAPHHLAKITVFPPFAPAPLPAAAAGLPIQARLWNNKPGVFSTKNDDPKWSYLGNSVYDVSKTALKRYAPINWHRQKGKVLYDYPSRHVCFMKGGYGRFKNQADLEVGFTASVEGDKATITSKGFNTRFAASLDSGSGDHVVDFGYSDESKQVGKDIHVGHKAIPAAEGASVPSTLPPKPPLLLQKVL